MFPNFLHFAKRICFFPSFFTVSSAVPSCFLPSPLSADVVQRPQKPLLRQLRKTTGRCPPPRGREFCSNFGWNFVRILVGILFTFVRVLFESCSNFVRFFEFRSNFAADFVIRHCSLLL
jgi:hypothetical protein